MLDFDEDEALLAIVSVTVFAIVLCDQIDSKIAFDAAAANAGKSSEPVSLGGSLLDQVADKLAVFAKIHIEGENTGQSAPHDYYRLEGALAGYLTTKFSNVEGISVTQHALMSGYEADIVVSNGSEKIVIELTRTRLRARVSYLTQRAVAKVSRYLDASDVSGAAVLIYNSTNTEQEYEIRTLADSIKVVAPPTVQKKSA